MKRLDMILLISNDLQKHENIFRGYAKGSIPLKCAADNLATYVLKAIEEARMLPPEIEGGLNEWEPEDEYE